MTHSRDTDRILDRWMDDGPRVVADRVIAGAMTEIQTTRQRGARRALLKELFMTWNHAAIVLGPAAVIIVGIATYQYLSGGGQGAADLAESPRDVGASELPDIVVTNENAPEGWAVDATLRGREVLAYLIRYGQVSNATPGFIDGRATDFCAEGHGCGTSWVALYGSEAGAEAAFSVLHGEMQVGWGLGADDEALGFGEDEGSSYRNNLGNAAANHAYLWRKGNLLLGVLGVGELEGDGLRPFAEELNTRSR
jgi:hypothetical protein